MTTGSLSNRALGRVLLTTGLLLLAPLTVCNAAPFTIRSVLTGDIRPANPDNIVVRVGIVGDTASNKTYWTVDLDSALYHPNMVLGGFFFNLDLDPTQVTFSNFSPTAWQVTYNAADKNAQGSGGAAFDFESKDPPGSANNVTNSVNLTFTATLAGKFWTTGMFLNAPLSDGDAIVNPGAQAGAHLRSLSTAGCQTCTTDSGFAAGNYFNGSTAPPPPTPVPEPSSLVLLGGGGIAFLHSRRRARKAASTPSARQ